MWRRCTRRRGRRWQFRRCPAGGSRRSCWSASSWVDSLHGLDDPFDLVFLDAWKRDYIAYYEAVPPKLSGRGAIVAHKVLWGGAVLDSENEDTEAAAVVAFAKHVQADPRVDNALLTVADGLLMIWKRAENRSVPG